MKIIKILILLTLNNSIFGAAPAAPVVTPAEVRAVLGKMDWGEAISSDEALILLKHYLPTYDPKELRNSRTIETVFGIIAKHGYKEILDYLSAYPEDKKENFFWAFLINEHNRIPIIEIKNKLGISDQFLKNKLLNIVQEPRHRSAEIIAFGKLLKIGILPITEDMIKVAQAHNVKNALEIERKQFDDFRTKEEAALKTILDAHKKNILGKISESEAGIIFTRGIPEIIAEYTIDPEEIIWQEYVKKMKPMRDKVS